MKNPSSTLSLPNPTPLLLAMGALVAWVLLSSDAGPEGIWLIVALLLPVAGAIMYFLANRPDVGILVLCVAAAMPRFYAMLGGLKARPEHVVIGLLCLAAPVWWKKSAEPVRWIAPDFWLLGYIFFNFLSSYVMSVSPPQTLKWAAQQFLVMLAYFLLRITIVEPKTLRRVMHILIMLGAVEGAYAVLSFFSNLLFDTTFGIGPNQYGSYPGTYGAMYEANILGAFCGACLIMTLVVYFQERKRIFLVAAGLAFAGWVIALSRAAIGGVVIAAMLLAFVERKTHLIDRRGVKAVAATLLVVSLALAPAVVPMYVERFSTVSDLAEDDNTAWRLTTFAVAVDDIARHPILGNGTSSFQLLITGEEMGFGQDTEETGAWISNIELRVVHDTGAVGFAAFLAFLIALWICCRKVLRKNRSPELLALLFSGVVYCFTFQATEATLLAFSWVHLGLIACAVAMYQNAGVDMNKDAREAGAS
jgi:O-antigen ligase